MSISQLQVDKTAVVEAQDHLQQVVSHIVA